MKNDKFFVVFCVYSFIHLEPILDTIYFDCDKKSDYLYEICVLQTY